ncbi:hypothetical protein P5G65_06595 [Paenibacillus chondroitinus]|uniref:Uncharacterized protein n=1 Tax=Paenibacillus chondroitinus TaxID=59842 RepID=A0ABU6D747_9BACL|nr:MULTISPECIES: hypothetical protein [Paenibacillus]MCY9662639.1 hypothetical protein [Paenibacillus anseongense]MEB4793557.1 hypothetical protein [Paenibacillus chondroitinus]
MRGRDARLRELDRAAGAAMRHIRRGRAGVAGAGASMCGAGGDAGRRASARGGTNGAGAPATDAMRHIRRWIAGNGRHAARKALGRGPAQARLFSLDEFQWGHLYEAEITHSVG